MRTLIPRWLIFSVMVIFIANLGAINIYPAHADPQFVAMVTLLEWRDPDSGQQLRLPVDRNAPVAQQVVDLQDLSWLDLSGNQLSELPPEIGKLTNLEALYLSHNSISKLPPEIINLTNLQVLVLDSIQLSKIPPELWNLINLQTSNLVGN